MNCTRVSICGCYIKTSAGGEEYVYQSCTQHGGSMEGEFTFVEGTLARPGPEFNAACPRFHLRIPDYIF